MTDEQLIQIAKRRAEGYSAQPKAPVQVKRLEKITLRETVAIEFTGQPSDGKIEIILDRHTTNGVFSPVGATLLTKANQAGSQVRGVMKENERKKQTVKTRTMASSLPFQISREAERMAAQTHGPFVGRGLSRRASQRRLAASNHPCIDLC